MDENGGRIDDSRGRVQVIIDRLGVRPAPMACVSNPGDAARLPLRAMLWFAEKNGCP